MLGSLMILVSGSKVNLPNSDNESGTRCCSVNTSGNSANTRAATEISLAVTSIPAGLANARTTGKNELVANIGASSVNV